MARDHKKTPYSNIERRIDKLVPDNTKVLTLMHFWFGLQNNEIYNSHTRWEHTSYKDLKDLLRSGDLDYVVISDFITNDFTGTSGRQIRSKKVNRRYRYYNQVKRFAVQKGMLEATIKTSNYGQIFIYKLINKENNV